MTNALQVDNDAQIDGNLTAGFVVTASSLHALGNSQVDGSMTANLAVNAGSLAVAGNAQINGNLTVSGTVSKGGGSFRIDHPLDPENKYLYHSFVESPDMMNIYNGNVVTDEDGRAIIELPDWFEALNSDFRYQLTVIGTFAQAIVAEKIHNGRFLIRTDVPNVEVSWQVTGIRHDPWAAQNRIPVEEWKPVQQRGSVSRFVPVGDCSTCNRPRRVSVRSCGHSFGCPSVSPGKCTGCPWADH
ncbi:MAG: hypothetical protein IPK83_18500 [Planctomycetes bacterium]|nr:hypothetical protein [Planctomycetota bacterium]